VACAPVCAPVGVDILRTPEQSEVEAQCELVRTTFARADFKFAKTVSHWLATEYAPTGSELHLAWWTALVVAYARPFTNNDVGRISERRFERFDASRRAADPCSVRRTRFLCPIPARAALPHAITTPEDVVVVVCLHVLHPPVLLHLTRIVPPPGVLVETGSQSGSSGSAAVHSHVTVVSAPPPPPPCGRFRAVTITVDVSRR
jgi:hypothetical protein